MLPIENMTKGEKLQMMEALWIDLTREDEEFLSPEWHEEILRFRENRIKSGKEEYQDWEAAKKKLRDNLL